MTPSAAQHLRQARPDNVTMDSGSSSAGGWNRDAIRLYIRTVKPITAAGLLALVVAAGCATSVEPAASPATPSPLAAATSAGPCESGSALRAEIEAFLIDYNAGLPGIADRFFASAPNFQWYSEAPLRLNAAAYDRSTLEQYLVQRHADGDRLTLVSLQVNSKQGDIGNFGFVLRRGNQNLGSKGAIDCTTGKFIVWSIGAPGSA